METKGSEPAFSLVWGLDRLQWKYRGLPGVWCADAFTQVHG